MASLNANKVSNPVYTHGGAKASHINHFDELVRSTQACMLWEDEFYEDGATIADRIKGLVHKCKPNAVADLALNIRTNMGLRHVPLLLTRELARHKDLAKYPGLVKNLLSGVIQRPDELSEFLSIYWKDGKQPLSAQVKKGLAGAFTKFNEYSLAKYRGEGKDIELRDVLMLSHAKPKDVSSDMKNFTKQERKLIADCNTVVGSKLFKDIRPNGFTNGEQLFMKVVNNTLETPDTWEVQLSAGKDKAETFTRLMVEGKLGALAFLRNLRNMKDAGVSKAIVKDYANTVKVDRILPFRFIAAARAVPGWEDVIEPMMFRCLSGMPKIPGKTVFVVDISGSMGAKLSSKSDLSRMDTALALAILARELCEDVAIYATAGDDYTRIHATDIVPNRRGFALADAISAMNSTLGGGGIFLTQVMDYVFSKEKTADRVIVLTDEQDCDKKCNPADAKAFGKRNYLINIASAQRGISYNKWTHITGWSEQVLSYITASEMNFQMQ